jgi:hypothetical protein
VFWALAVILLAFAGFSVVVIRRPRPAPAYSPNSRFDVEQLKGFVYVGAVVLALVSVMVITTGLIDGRSGRAEALAVLGFFGYALYLLASAGALYLMARRSR